MALEGGIKEFGVSDILQLVSQQHKTGILQVEKNDEKAEIYFINGQLVQTRSSQIMTRNTLGEILIRSKLVPPDKIKRALDVQQDTFESLGHILLKDGIISEDDLEKVLLAQTYETFYDILQWREGTYRFLQEKVGVDPNLLSLPGLESILLDVFRMIDEWPHVKKAIESFDMVFDKVDGKGPEELGSDDALVFKLVDGNRTVQAIINESLLGRFGASKILALLLQHGYIVLVSKKADKRESREGMTFQKAVGVVSYVALLVTVCALLLLPTGFPKNILPLFNPDSVKQSYLPNYFEHRRIMRLENALEIYYLKFGLYPESIRELENKGILQDDDVKACEEQSVIYLKNEDSYTIEVKK